MAHAGPCIHVRDRHECDCPWAKCDCLWPSDWTHWPTNEQDSDSLTTVEATAYALLQKVKLGQLEEAHGIARWLVQARAYGGGYESTQVRALCPPGLLRDTHSVLAGSQLLLGAWSPPCHTKALLGATGLGQDGPGPSQASKGQQGPDAAAMVSPAPQTTVVGMQALAGYQLALPPQPAMELRVQVSAPKQHVTEHWAIDASNAYLSRTSTKKVSGPLPHPVMLGWIRPPPPTHHQPLPCSSWPRTPWKSAPMGWALAR